MTRRWRLSCCLILLLCAAASSSVRAQSILANPIPADRDLAPYGLTLAWWNRAVIDPARDALVHLTADEDAIYAQAASGIVTAFDAESGSRRWSTLIGRPDEQSFAVSTNEEQLLLVVGLELYAVDKFSGKILWELTLPHHPSASPEVDANQVYIGMVDGSIYSYDLRRIRQLFQEGRLPQWTNLAFVWRYKAPLEITSRPISASRGRLVIFASLNGSLYGVAAKERRLQYQFETETHSPIRAPVGHGEGSLLVPTEDSRLFCINEENGKRRWAFTSGSPIREQPRIIGPHVFTAPQREGLYCLNSSSGIIQWRQRRASSFLAANPKSVFASDDVGNVLMLSRDDGSLVGGLPLRQFSIRVQNDRTDRLYLATGDGLMACVRDRELEFPIYHKYPERRPILPELAPDGPADGADDPPLTQ